MCIAVGRLNTTVANGIVASVKEHKPKDGLVQMLVITEKQYSKMEYVVGEKGSTILIQTRGRLYYDIC